MTVSAFPLPACATGTRTLPQDGLLCTVICTRVKLIRMPIKRYWTSYWREQGWSRNMEYEPISLSAGAFSKRNVSVGDVLYVVSLHAGQLLLGGRMTVGRIVTREEAVRVSK